MTPEQLEALIQYINEKAEYEAARMQWDEWDHRPLQAAEKQLREAFRPALTVGDRR